MDDAEQVRSHASNPQLQIGRCFEVSSGSPEISEFLYEIGLLKRHPRTGWLLVGVPEPESVAEHSFRASVIASVIAVMEGADPQRAAFLALWQDSQETRTTDLPHLTKGYVTATANKQVTGDQVRPLPLAIADVVSSAVAEYESAETPDLTEKTRVSLTAGQVGAATASLLPPRAIVRTR